MNSKIAPDSCFIFLFLLLIILSCHSCISPRERSIKAWEKHEWKIVKVEKNEEPTWEIHTRKIVGTNFLEYKIEGDVKSSPNACISSFKQDIHKLANGSRTKKYPTYEIIDASEDSLLTYVIHNEPFPFKDTEMSVRYHFFQDTVNAVEGVNWKEAWEEDSAPPPSKKLSRVQTFRGSWHFSPGSTSYTKAVNSVNFDAKKMPHWLVNKMVVKFLVEGLEKIRAMTAK